MYRGRGRCGSQGPLSSRVPAESLKLNWECLTRLASQATVDVNDIAPLGGACRLPVELPGVCGRVVLVAAGAGGVDGYHVRCVGDTGARRAIDLNCWGRIRTRYGAAVRVGELPYERNGATALVCPACG